MISVLNKKIYKLIDIYFENVTNKQLNNNIFEIYNNNLCVKFGIDDTTFDKLSIFITDLNKCGYSGTNTLERLELLSKNINIKFLCLEDQSSILCGEFMLDLATIYIFSKGQSWYNSLGYKQENYLEESRNWEIIRNCMFNNLKFNEIDFELIQLKNKGWFTNPLDFIAYLLDYSEINKDNCNEILEYSIDLIKDCQELLDNTISVTVGIIYIKIKNKEICHDDEKLLIYYLYIYLCSFFIEYTRYPLIKYIR